MTLFLIRLHNHAGSCLLWAAEHTSFGSSHKAHWCLDTALSSEPSTCWLPAFRVRLSRHGTPSSSDTYTGQRGQAWSIQRASVASMIHHHHENMTNTAPSHISQHSMIQCSDFLMRLLWTHVRLGAFGAKLQKPFRLFGTARYLRTLYRARPAKLPEAELRQFYSVDAFGGVTGGKSLEASGAYTPEFGQAVFQSFKKSSKMCQQEAQSILKRLRSEPMSGDFSNYNREAFLDKDLKLQR